MTYPPIAEYAAIGDGRSAGLVSREGALEWLCLPRFDSPPIFAAVLDRERGGAFSLRPAGRSRATRRYVADTNVLETVHDTDGGRLRVVDWMPIASEADKRRALHPEREVLRLVECAGGEVEVEVGFDPRLGYERRRPHVVDRGALGWFCRGGREAVAFRSEIPVAAGGDRPGVHGREILRAGERRWTGFTYTDHDPGVVPVFGDLAERKLARSVAWWSEWAGECRYEGPWRDAVVRSALALKLLAYAPSGAIVAAPTTSLPERIGGVRNWDYRYCWLRDASLTVQALADLGYEPEAEAYLSWILHSTRRSWPELDVLYDLHGRACPPEREIEGLEGYAGSRPVRVGNEARKQLQLDVYGEVADAVHEFVLRGGRLDRASRRFLAGIGRTVARRWREPDEGIWEVRTEPRHHTYSKVMCWVALDRLLALHAEGALEIDTAPLARERDAIRETVERRGWNAGIGSYTSVLDGDDVDASLFLLARYGFVDAGSPRVESTCRRIHDRLATGPLVYRYVDQPDGLPKGEGAFGIACFWGVDCLARQGAVEKAVAAFEALLGYANDVGLYAEEIDPATGAALGNFPQAFTHVGLIDAALTIAERTGTAIGHGAGRTRSMRVERK